MSFGSGIFARRDEDYPPAELAALFDWACVPVIVSSRRATNRDRAWWRECREAGVLMSGFDWLPTPARWRDGLLGALDFLAEVGAVAFVTDPEVEWKGHPEEMAAYMAFVRRECDARGLALGFTSFGTPSFHRPFPWAESLPLADFGLPQVYDRDHALTPGYAARGVREYVERGARVAFPALGAYRRGPTRWRTAAELRAHVALAPAGTRIFWPLAGRVPAELRPVFAELRGGGTPGGGLLERAARSPIGAAGVLLAAAGLALMLSGDR
ncbi:MAG: hypothetical protein SangKO_031880 [Sandaracinaceae bacterium]